MKKLISESHNCNLEYMKLRTHTGHKITCVCYGDNNTDPCNISIECEDCNEVLYSADREIMSETTNNDEWIPAQEKPEEDGFYIATLDGEIIGQEEPFVGTAEFEKGKWVDDTKDYKCVLAWQPFPEPCKILN